MMPRYFKMIEIDADTFIESTGEDFYGISLIAPTDNGVYVVVDEEETFDMIIPMDCFD